MKNMKWRKRKGGRGFTLLFFWSSSSLSSRTLKNTKNTQEHSRALSLSLDVLYSLSCLEYWNEKHEMKKEKVRKRIYLALLWSSSSPPSSLSSRTLKNSRTLKKRLSRTLSLGRLLLSLSCSLALLDVLVLYFSNEPKGPIYSFSRVGVDGSLWKS